MNCRNCDKILTQTVLDFGCAPLSNAYLNEGELSKPEIYFPLKIRLCDHCWLVQTEDYVQKEALFNSGYAYFSSTSKSWLEHAKLYVRKMIYLLELDSNSYVLEIACNDGYLLKNFVENGIPCLGVEPTQSTALAAEQLGITVVKDFFDEAMGARLASETSKFDLVIGKNVFAHVPNIRDFTRGLKIVLKRGGVITLEFHHLLKILEKNQFDTIYHEHFSYLTLHAAQTIFNQAGLKIWNVEEVETHGGSLRIYGCHQEDSRTIDLAVSRVLSNEAQIGLQTSSGYEMLQEKANKLKNNFLEFLLTQKRKGKFVVGYGAAAKGNTLLNYAGIKHDLISCVLDGAEAKQGMYLPGSHIPVFDPQHYDWSKVDSVIIFPWNIRDEIVQLIRQNFSSKARLYTFIPEFQELGVD